MYKAIIAYDGTRYFGWQKTRSGPTIQEEIEKGLYRLTGERALPESASRTDRGVHAQGQVIQFSLSSPKEAQWLFRGLNGVLPPDIRILHLAPALFHPTLDALGKEYWYRISLGAVQNPIDRLYAWHFPYPLNGTHIEEAAQELIGRRDFSSFANQKEKNPFCTVESIIWDGMFRIRGDRFLYKMVRNLVGILTSIGSGKLAKDAIPSILEAKDRKRGGVTAPAHGLYLHQVFYPLK